MKDKPIFFGSSYKYDLPVGTIPEDDLPKVNLTPIPSKVSPEHYKGKGMEVIDVIDAFDLDLYQGSIVQYVIRFKKKEGLTDLLKAKWYLDRLITKYDNIGRTKD